MEQGAKMLLEGKSFEQAQSDMCKSLQIENKKLKEDLTKAKKLNKVGGDGIDFSIAPENEKKSIIRIKGQGE